MSFTQSIETCLRKYAVFAGRARPAELWWFALFITILYVVGHALDLVLGLRWGGFGLVETLAVLGLLVPYLAAAARRLHDAGLSAWWLLLQLVPCGSIALLIMLLRPSRADNRYGPATIPQCAGGSVSAPSAP